MVKLGLPRGENHVLFPGKLLTILLLTTIIFTFSLQDLKAGTSESSGLAIPGTEDLRDNPQQGIRITGTVTDAATGEALPGVNIIEQGTTNGVITDIGGNYSISVRNESSSLVFSFVGYVTQTAPVQGNRVIDVQLATEVEALDEVVVIGYGSQKKLTVTGSISTIESEEVAQQPVNSVQNALTGRATGLIAVQRGTAPGEDYADLYVRGRATYGNSSPLILVDGIERDITTIDPNEIQSISILKDASATAVYGVRGANGVIVVTTKTGHAAARPSITFSANYGMETPTRLPGLLDSWDWATFYNMGQFNDNLIDANGDGIINQTDVDMMRETYAPEFSDEDIAIYKSGEDPVFHPNTDWYDIFLGDRIEPREQYNLNISGGTQTARYFVSMGYMHQKGIFEGMEFWDDIPSNANVKRYNIRANTDFNWTKKFSSSLKFSTQIFNGRNTNWTSGNQPFLNNVFTSNALGLAPVIDGKIVTVNTETDKYMAAGNPIFIFGNNYDIEYIARTTIDLTTTYDLSSITEGLSINGKFAYDNYYRHTNNRGRPVAQYEARRTAPGYEGDYYTLIPLGFDGPFFGGDDGYSQNYRLYGEAKMNYDHTFSGGHTVGAMILGTMERIFRGGNPALPFNYMGLVARATYNYQTKYMAEFNMGYNGSENFKKGNQFGFFPSFSLGYVISEESFFPENNVLTFLKIRGSWGKVGNDKIGGNRFLYTPSSYTRSGSSFRIGESYSPVSGIYREGKIGNPDISWEVATKGNVGAELQFFNNRIRVQGDFFKERREGILDNYNNVPATFGDLSLLPSFNLGIVENWGYEFELGFRSPRGKDFQYWINGNYTFARNKLIFNDEVPPAYDYQRRTGLPLGQPFMLVADGFYNTWEEVNDPLRVPTDWDAVAAVQPGDTRYIDINEDGIINADDRVARGYGNIPEIVYGITLGFRWKGFDASVLLQGTEHMGSFYGNRTIFAPQYGARTEAAFDAWTPEKYEAGEEILYPRISLINESMINTQQNTMLYQDSRYLRLKTAEIGYTLPANLTRRIGSDNMRVYVNGHNLLTFTPKRWWDPESVNQTNQAYPVTRVINFGVRANF